MLYKTNMNELWKMIKKARQDAGLSQEQLGNSCKPPISKAAVGLWESDNPEKRTKPKYRNLKTISRVTGVPMEALLNAASSDNTEEHETHKPTQKQLDLIDRYESATPKVKKAVLAILEAGEEFSDYLVGENPTVTSFGKDAVQSSR